MNRWERERERREGQGGGGEREREAGKDYLRIRRYYNMKIKKPQDFCFLDKPEYCISTEDTKISTIQIQPIVSNVHSMINIIGITLYARYIDSCTSACQYAHIWSTVHPEVAINEITNRPQYGKCHHAAIEPSPVLVPGSNATNFHLKVTLALQQTHEPKPLFSKTSS